MIDREYVTIDLQSSIGHSISDENNSLCDARATFPGVSAIGFSDQPHNEEYIIQYN